MSTGFGFMLFNFIQSTPHNVLFILLASECVFNVWVDNVDYQE